MNGDPDAHTTSETLQEEGFPGLGLHRRSARDAAARHGCRSISRQAGQGHRQLGAGRADRHHRPPRGGEDGAVDGAAARDRKQGRGGRHRRRCPGKVRPRRLHGRRAGQLAVGLAGASRFPTKAAPRRSPTSRPAMWRCISTRSGPRHRWRATARYARWPSSTPRAGRHFPTCRPSITIDVRCASRSPSSLFNSAAPVARQPRGFRPPGPRRSRALDEGDPRRPHHDRLIARPAMRSRFITRCYARSRKRDWREARGLDRIPARAAAPGRRRSR